MIARHVHWGAMRDVPNQHPSVMSLMAKTHVSLAWAMVIASMAIRRSALAASANDAICSPESGVRPTGRPVLRFRVSALASPVRRMPIVPKLPQANVSMDAAKHVIKPITRAVVPNDHYVTTSTDG